MLEEEDELPDDEEEILVYVEFDGSVASNTFGNEKLTLDMIGLDKEHPIMQVNGKYYEGTYQDVVGTYMFFEKDKNPPVDDPVFDATPTLKYRAKTRKLLKMQRIFVEPKAEMLGDSNDTNCIPNMETINAAGIPPRYQEAALKSWQNMRDDRMEALNKYLEKQRIREEKRSQGIEPDSESDDDNPFAMYKPDAKNKRKKAPADDANTPSEECPVRTDDRNLADNETADGRNSRLLTVIDPGPSTSKDSQPWRSPAPRASEKYESKSDSDDEGYRINLPNVTGKHRATVKVMTKGKVRKYSRGTKKKCNKKAEKLVRKSDESEDSADDLLRENEEERVDDAPTDDGSVTMEALRKADDVTSENSDSTKRPEVDVCNPDEAPALTNHKRKVEKQQKRDEKMRFLAERLKRAAEEVRLRTNKTDEASGVTETLRDPDEISENAESTMRMEVDVSNAELKSESTTDKHRFDEKMPLVSEKFDKEIEESRLNVHRRSDEASDAT